MIRLLIPFIFFFGLFYFVFTMKYTWSTIKTLIVAASVGAASVLATVAVLFLIATLGN